MNRKTYERGDKIAEFRSHSESQDESHVQREQNNGQARQKLPPEVHAFLGHRLRAVYSNLVNEPIPSALLDLLDRLKAQELETPGHGAALGTNEAKEKA